MRPARPSLTCADRRQDGRCPSLALPAMAGFFNQTVSTEAGSNGPVGSKEWGMTNWDDYKAAREGEALALVLAADAIHAADEAHSDEQMHAALEQNLELWLAFKALSISTHSVFPEGIRESIVKLADFVSEECIRTLAGRPGKNLTAIANINLQIAEGLLEALNVTEQQVKDGLLH